MSTTTKITLPEEVMTAVAQGRTIEAIKLVREHTGLDLKQSKNIVDMLGGQSSLLASMLGPQATAPFIQDPAYVQALQEGNKIEAIRLLHERGMDLKDAKDAVEADLQPKTRLPTEMHMEEIHKMLTEGGVTTSSMKVSIEVPSASRPFNDAPADIDAASHGLGLPDAKPQPLDRLHTPGEVPRWGAGSWLIALVAVAALVAYYFFLHH